MSELLVTKAVPGSLRRRRLPRSALRVNALASILVTIVLFATTPAQGRVDFVLVSAGLFIIGLVCAAWRIEGGRRARDRLAQAVALAALALTLLPLLSILGFTLAHGLHRFDATFLTHSMRNVAESDNFGGAYHALIGTLEQTAIATVISVPLGLLAAVYLVEYVANTRYGRLISLTVDVMTGLPSIIAGLFILSLWVLTLKQGFSGLAGALALTVLMLPIVIRTSEEILRLVPGDLREASLALGVRKWRTTVSVVLPAALPGITTGVMLALARVMGETAPVLLTVFGNPSLNMNPFNGPQESLPLYVFGEAQQPNNTAIDRAWAGALLLILLILLLNVAARLITRRWRTYQS